MGKAVLAGDTDDHSLLSGLILAYITIYQMETWAGHRAGQAASRAGSVWAGREVKAGKVRQGSRAQSGVSAERTEVGTALVSGE